MTYRNSGKDWIWESTRQALYARDGYCCQICGDSPEDDDEVRLSLDHVVLGAGNRPDNLATVCISCNSSRRDADPDTWRHGAGRRLETAASRPLTPELRAIGLTRARQLRPDRFAAQKARALNRRARQLAPFLSTEAPF